jgi:hypothetical protein
MQWLCEFQILACVPLSGSVAIEDIARLSGIPKEQICRVTRMTATAGFLQQPQPGSIAHTRISAAFVANPSLLDAVMFLTESATPAALQMTSFTQRFGNSERSSESAYSLAFGSSKGFQSALEQRPKLQRQWSAYLQYAIEADACVIEVLTRLDWPNLGRAYVVEVSLAST